MILKSIVVTAPNGVHLSPNIVERVDEKVSIFTWPSAYVLASYVMFHKILFEGKFVVELGGGTALPSIVAGLCGASKVITTERTSETEMVEVIKASIKLNGLQNVCSVQALDWGCIDPDGELADVDIILGADVLYSTEHFDSVLLTVCALLSCRPEAVFVTSYQERR